MDKITLDAFVEMVRQMRFNQRRYFRHRTPEHLQQSKEWEAKVDKVIAELLNKQNTLF